MAHLKRGVSIVSGALDFEEGEWTPEATGSVTGFPTHAQRIGYYIRTGDIVHVTGFLQFAADGVTGVGQGDLNLTNLPFTVINTNYYRSCFAMSGWGFATTTYGVVTLATPEFGDTKATTKAFTGTGKQGGTFNGAASDALDDGGFTFSGNYRINP
jgi:hypothetical protein